MNIRTGDGKDKTISQSIRVLRAANGRIESMQGIVRDVTIPVKDGATAQDYTISIAFEKKAGAA